MPRGVKRELLRRKVFFTGKMHTRRLLHTKGMLTVLLAGTRARTAPMRSVVRAPFL
jgi:hypothetical protein